MNNSVFTFGTRFGGSESIHCGVRVLYKDLCYNLYQTCEGSGSATEEYDGKVWFRRCHDSSADEGSATASS